jgi:hypothetical protein
MRDIKEYIHHYLGCECIISDLPKRMILEGGRTKIGGYLLDCKDECTIKPILRKLSSMTEEEFKEFKNICDADFSKMTVIESMTKGEVVTRLCHSAFAQSYLLSKHFDLFDLISSGLAIDKDELEKLKL